RRKSSAISASSARLAAAALAWLILALAQQGKWDDARDQIRMMGEFYREHDLADVAAVAQREGWNAEQQALYAQAWAGAEG
ncbi:MAG: hypothetical protein SNJ80_17260, partial [Anaerolinea sp.]